MVTEELADRLPRDLEPRVEEAIHAFRENHRHPLNVALHALGYALTARGALRFLRRRMITGMLDMASGVGLVVLGHRIEGNEPFTTIRAFRGAGSERVLP